MRFCVHINMLSALIWSIYSGDQRHQSQCKLKWCFIYDIFRWPHTQLTWSRKLCAMSWLLPRSPVPSTTSVGTLRPVVLLLLGSVDEGLALPLLRSLSWTMSWYVKLVLAHPCSELALLSTSRATGSNMGILTGWSVASPISGWFDMARVEFWEEAEEEKTMNISCQH